MRRPRFVPLVVGGVAAVLAASAYAQEGGSSVFAPSFTVPARLVPSSNVRPWAEAWAGFSFQNNAYGGYWGGNFALNNPRNVWDDGFLLRYEGSAGTYHYATGVIASGSVNAVYNTGAFMFGYRKKVGDGLATGYVGVNYQHDNTDDPTAKIHDTKAGAKVLGEYYTPFGDGTFDFWGQVGYSSVYNTFTAYMRPGMRVAKDLPGFVKEIRIGPDVGYFSNFVPYRQYNVGGFAQFALAASSSFTIAGGYRDPTTPGSADGYYVNFGFYRPFQ